MWLTCPPFRARVECPGDNLTEVAASKYSFIKALLPPDSPETSGKSTEVTLAVSLTLKRVNLSGANKASATVDPANSADSRSVSLAGLLLVPKAEDSSSSEVSSSSLEATHPSYFE